jgi:hypothetical protein
MSQNSSSLLLNNILESKSVVNRDIYAANIKNRRRRRMKKSTDKQKLVPPVNFLSRREKLLLEMNRMSLGEPIRISSVLYDIDEQEEEELRMNSRKKVKKPSELYNLIKSSLPSENSVSRDRNEIQESLKQRQDLQQRRQEHIFDRKSAEFRARINKEGEEEAAASETAGKVSILKEKVASMKEEEEFWHLFIQILELIPEYGSVVQQMGAPPAELGDRKEFLTHFLAQIIKEKERQESFKERERDYLDHIKRIEGKLVRYEESEEHREIDSKTQLALKDFRHIYHLGEGGHGRVNLMSYNKNNKEIYAVKEVAKVKK